MVLTYKECMEKYGSDYMLKKEIAAGRICRKEKGIYSESKNCSEIEIMMAKYPRAVYTGESACYYYGLTDMIPDKHVLATKRSDSRIKDANVRQVFVKDSLFDMGRKVMEYRGTRINIYSPERLLVEIIRAKTKLPFDFYKEVIENYRGIRDQLDFFVVESCAGKFRGSRAILNAVQLEVL